MSEQLAELSKFRLDIDEANAVAARLREQVEALHRTAIEQASALAALESLDVEENVQSRCEHPSSGWIELCPPDSEHADYLLIRRDRFRAALRNERMSEPDQPEPVAVPHKPHPVGIPHELLPTRNVDAAGKLYICSARCGWGWRARTEQEAQDKWTATHTGRPRW
jgi:hypothetical protein